MQINRTTQYLLYAIIVALCIFLYGNTIGHGYALDDAIVITENVYVKQGISGIPDILSNDTFMGFFQEKKNLVSGGRYRPLSLLTFSLEYELLGLNPMVSHLINILLYALTGILLLLVFQQLLKNYISRQWINVVNVAVLLFLLHPLHTEVVANIKGRDEILTFLFSLFAFRYILFDLQSQNKKNKQLLIWSGVFFFLALMSKENAITFLFIIPVSLYFFTEAKRSDYFRIAVPLLVATFLFLYIRGQVLGYGFGDAPNELMNNPFLGMSGAEKMATIIYTWGLYLKLLIFPHPLTYDYYPYHIPLMSWNMPIVWLIALLYIAIGLYALLYMRKKSIYVYGIWFYLASLSIVSNLIFPVGTFMNERFIYIASFGFTLIAGYVIGEMLFRWMPEKKARIVSLALLSFIFVAASYKTIDRNRAWKDDFTLFTTDVRTSVNSAKVNCTAGGKLLEKAKKTEEEHLRDSLMEQSIQYLRRSVSIHPTYRDALLLLGNAHYEYNQDYDSTFYYYKRILRSNPNYKLVYDNMELLLSGHEDVDKKIAWYEDVYKINPRRYEVLYHLGNLYGKHKQDIEKALLYLQKAVQVNPGSKRSWKDLGVAYAISGDLEKALEANKKAIQLAPDDADVHSNIGMVYRAMGDVKKANEHFHRAQALKN
jgi:protein O-mannosyl-transferase